MSGTKIISGDNYECSNGDQYNLKDQATLIQAKELYLHPHEQRQPIIPHQPPSLDACFLGRDKELAKLLEQLQPGKVVAICGPGGMGKSALAAQAVHQLEPDRFPDGIIFHRFYEHPRIEQALQRIAKAFGIEAEPSLEIAVEDALASRKALLILDGAEEADDLPALLKLRGGCGVLITSRKRSDAPGARLDLKPLAEQDAAAVFREYSGVAADDVSVAGICKILGGWPVGLRIAGRYCSSTGESAADYLRWLEKKPFRKLAAGQHQEDNATLLLRRSVAQVSADAVQVLRMAGVLAFTLIGLGPVLAVLYKEDDEEDDLELRSSEALGELVAYGLLEKHGECWQVSHALIHTYARIELPLNKESLEHLAWYCIDFCERQSKAGLKGYALLNGVPAHCLRLMESCLASKLWQEVKDLQEAMREYLSRQGHWADELTAIEMRLAAARQKDDREDENWCLNSLGCNCGQIRKYEKALAYFEQSLQISRELNNIAEIYRLQGKYTLAFQQYQQSLTIRHETGYREGEGWTLNNIGRAYYDIGKYEQALKYYEQCLPIRREVGDKIGEVETLSNIGLIYRAQGDYTKALEYHEQALAIAQELGDRVGEAESRWNIGLTYEDLGDLAKAEEYISQALQIAEHIGHPSLEQWCEELARVQAKRQG